MKKDSNKFLKLNREDAPKIELAERKAKFVEIYQKFDNTQSADQSERCLECGNPYCQWKCPLHNYIPVWLKFAYENRIEEAVELSHETNSLPEICGRVCPQDRLCEGACTLNDGFGAVTIGGVEKYITDTAFANGWSYQYPPLNSDKTVAIIGSGPAGLSCADVLARNGIKSVIFERSGFIGGLLTYGIPAFKLEKEIVEKRYEILKNAGVEFRLNCEVGSDISYQDLERDFAAVFIATGTYQAVTEPSINNDDVNIWQALDYLSSVNQDVLDRKDISRKELVANRKVLVLGGGDTSMDCIRTSLRLGASEVIGAYRRSEGDMPGSKKEFINAKEEGAQFEFNIQPVSIIYSGDTIRGVRFIRTQQVLQDSGKHVLEHIQCSEFVIEADIIITAFGFKPEKLSWLSEHIKIDTHGRIKLAKKSEQLVGANVYAGGDIVRGASLVVHAVADGMQAGRDIVKSLS